ncbi:hypothetical protein ABPG72_009158 [Tetrahymena utriculariae]
MLRQVLRFSKQLFISAPKLQFRPVYFFQDNNDRTRVETNSATWAHNLPKENKFNTETLEKQEVESRILKVLSNFEQVNLKNLRWDQNFKKLGLDSLDQTALLASIEHEFTILFPDGIFEGFENLEQVVNYILKNINAI